MSARGEQARRLTGHDPVCCRVTNSSPKRSSLRTGGWHSRDRIPILSVWCDRIGILSYGRTVGISLLHAHSRFALLGWPGLQQLGDFRQQFVARIGLLQEDCLLGLHPSLQEFLGGVAGSEEDQELRVQRT